MDNIHLLGDSLCFISTNSASSGFMERACPEPHVGDLPSFLYSCNLVFRRRLQMARSAIRRARPTIPPATPPAIAAVFGFGEGVMVWSVDWPVAVTVGTLLETEVEVVEPCAVDVPMATPRDVPAILADVGDITKEIPSYKTRAVAAASGSKESWVVRRSPGGQS